ncbi:MAG: SDR family NAD(P)-dependent oxidoreductase [Bacteroidales bacterium]|nr:SDR family NAD(P)-dependent oxidoreductase [Bacteroidales bacterium]
MISLKGQYALLTGASSGIGKAIAQQLAHEGVNLIMVGRDISKLQKIKEYLGECNVYIEYHKVDLTVNEDLDKIHDYISSSFNKLDILVHNAGILQRNQIEKSSLLELELQIQVNFKAPYIITKSLLPFLKESKGQIVFINSSVIQRPNASLSHYSSSKFALKGFTDSLREEVNADGIRVTSIYPGKTATSMQEQLHLETNVSYKPHMMLQTKDIANTVLHILQLPKTAEITDLYIRPMKKS